LQNLAALEVAVWVAAGSELLSLCHEYNFSLILLGLVDWELIIELGVCIHAHHLLLLRRATSRALSSFLLDLFGFGLAVRIKSYLNYVACADDVACRLTAS